MALLFTDGFDWTTAIVDISKKWTSRPNELASIVAGRNGNCLRLYTNSGMAYKTLAPSGSTAIVGFGLKQDVFAEFLELLQDNDRQLYAQVTVAGQIRVTNGSTTLATSAKNINAGEWYFVEVKVTFHPTAGAVEVRVNNETWINVTGVNTDRAGTGTYNRFGIIQGTGNGANYYDDLYICDASGSTNNDFLGDSAILTLRPNGDSTPLQWTPSTGSTHYTLVDDTTVNLSDYVYDSTTGQRDQYTLEDLTLTPVLIHAVVHNVIADKDEAGARGIKLYVKSATAEALSSQFYLSQDNPLNWQQVVPTDPNTGVAWTKSGVDAMEVGVETV